MRYLLLSDIHANAVALSAVLRHAESRGWQQVIFLGDAVGYYPQAEAVICALQALPLAAALLGNHDAVLLEGEAGSGSGALVNEILAQQRSTLSRSAKRFLAQLSPHVLQEGWEATHSTLAGTWEYVNSLERAQLEQPRLSRNLLLFGHTHVPAIYLFANQQGQRLSRSVPLSKDMTRYRLPPNAQVLFNPGSVGQPRDGIPRASYAIFDENARLLEHYRVPFDIHAVQQQIVAAGYPPALAARLERGR